MSTTAAKFSPKTTVGQIYINAPGSERPRFWVEAPKKDPKNLNAILDKTYEYFVGLYTAHVGPPPITTPKLVDTGTQDDQLSAEYVKAAESRADELKATGSLALFDANMTFEDVEKLSDLELTMLVAEKFFPPESGKCVPCYATDMGEAWKLVELMSTKMEESQDGFEWYGPSFKPGHRYLTNEGYPLGTTCWFVLVDWEGHRRYICHPTSAARVVCLAALRTVYPL